MANSQSDTSTLQPISAHYATNQTLARTLRKNPLTIRLLPLAATMRRVNWYTRPYENLQKGGLHTAPDLVHVTAYVGSHP